MSHTNLASQHCIPRKGKEHALDGAGIEAMLKQLPGWHLANEGKAIVKDFKFADFSDALAFGNALGWIAERENHHPDIEFGWGRCRVRFSTHDVGGISRNDFICAAKTEGLFDD